MAEMDRPTAVEQTERMSKEVRLSLVEVMLLDKLTLRAMQAKLLEDHGETINHVTLSRDVIQIKEALDLEKPGWDEHSEEELLRETIRRGFSAKDKTVSVKEALSAKKDLVRLLEAKAAGETFSIADLPDHERQYPMTDFEIELAHMPTDKLKAWMLEQLATIAGVGAGQRAQRHHPRHEAEIGVRFAGRDKRVHLIGNGVVVHRLGRVVAERFHRPAHTGEGITDDLGSENSDDVLAGYLADFLNGGRRRVRPVSGLPPPSWTSRYAPPILNHQRP